MPVVLRVNMLPLLTLVAVMPAFALLAGSSAATASRGAASFALTGLLLQAGLGVCTGVQQATIMLVTRHVGVGRFAEAHGSMRLVPHSCLASLLSAAYPATYCAANLVLCSSVEAAARVMWAPRHRTNGDHGMHASSRSVCCATPHTENCVRSPRLFFAVTGRGSIATWILLVAHCCIGLPAAWQWASVTGGGPAALMQAHTGSWLLATLALAVCYASLPTVPPQATAVTLEGPEFSLETSALSSARARGVRLAQPLLDRDGGPA